MELRIGARSKASFVRLCAGALLKNLRNRLFLCILLETFFRGTLMATLKFWKCAKCGNILHVLNDKCDGLTCCGDAMKELKANTTDGAHEKHVPVIAVDGATVTVKVGSAEHPMADDHWIQWIMLHTEKGEQRKVLNPGEKPEATFVLKDDTVLAAYEYCNKHGLWKADC